MLLPSRNCAVAMEAPQSSYVNGAADLSWETISALLKEKASGIAIAIRSLSLCTGLVPFSECGLLSRMLQRLGIVTARANTCSVTLEITGMLCPMKHDEGSQTLCKEYC